MFQIGQSIGDYAILQELGKGGYGRVYKVEHTITGRREAMKVLTASNTNAGEESERFLREIRLQASLSHPNIAVVHTAFWVNDDLALVCELLEGQSLQQFLEQQQPAPRQAVEIVSQVLEALSYAHARGIIHRDISPANIFLTVGGTVKIIDFGLAKAATDLRLTREGSPIGAAHYMSPEQIRGAQDLDARTDIYSCGVLLYELLMGKKPFDGDSAFTIMKAHTEELPPPPSATNPQVPSALSAIVMRALNKKPEERFQSADAFSQAIGQAEPASAATPSARSLKRPVLIAAAVALTLLVGGLIARVTTRPGNAQSPSVKSFTPPPPPEEVLASPTPAVAKPPSGNVKSAKVAPKPHRQKTPSRAATSPAVSLPAGTLPASSSPVSTSPAAKTALVEEVPSTEPASAADGKSRNPVVKLGGVIKRMVHKDDKGK